MTARSSFGLAAVVALTWNCWDRGGFESSELTETFVPGVVTVTRIAPVRGPEEGGLSVAVGGTGFTSEHVVSLGGAPCLVEVISTTELRCTTGAHAPGQVDVVVTRGSNSVRLDDAFAYLPTSFASTTLLVGEYDPHGFVDGPAVDARFGGAGDMVVLGSSVFVVDAWNNAIREIDLATGEVSTFYDHIGWPGGIATDGVDLFLSQDGAIWRVRPSGLTLVAGTPEQSGAADGPPNTGRLSAPAGMTHLEGVLYVADASNDAVRAVDLATGNLTTVATGIDKPYDIATDGVDLAVVAYNGCSVYTVTTSGDVTLLAGTEGWNGTQDGTGSEARFGNLTGVSRLGADWIVADSDHHTLRRVTPAGVVTTWCGAAEVAGGSIGSCSDARFFHPFRFAITSGGELLVSDEAGAVRRIDGSAQVRVLAGELTGPGCVDGNASVARFGELTDGVADGDVLYVVDRWCSSIRRIDLVDGSVSTLTGGRGRWRADGPPATAGFDGPHGIALLDGRLYVTEEHGVTLRRFDLATGELDTVAGEANEPGSADGVGTDARFDTPMGIDVLGDDLLVLESWPGRLRRVDPVTGEVSTVAVSLSNRPIGVTVVGAHAFAFGGGTVERVELSSGTVESFSGQGCCGFQDGAASDAGYGELWYGESDGVSLVVADPYNHSVRRVAVADGSVASWLSGPDTVQENDSVNAIRSPRSVVLTPRGTWVLNRYGVRLLELE